MKLMYELNTGLTRNHSPLVGKDVSNTQFTIWHKQMQDPGERSASCSGESLRMPKGFSLERVTEEGPSTSIHPTDQYQEGLNSHRLSRNNKTSIDGCDEEIDVELTLSIGCSNIKKRLNSQMKTCSPEFGGS